MTENKQPEAPNGEDESKDRNPSPNYYRLSPMRIVWWYRNLEELEKFNAWIVGFTGVLSIMAIVQFFAYLETERAYVVIDDAQFLAGTPQVEDGGIDTGLFIKNVGKHVAIISQFHALMEIYVVQKELPTFPEYRPDAVPQNLVVAPMVPQQRLRVPLREVKAPPPIPRDQVIEGIKNGSIPFRVYGFIKYKLGYLWFSGITGYCFEYVPESKRTIGPAFRTCQNPNYTYAH